MHKSFYASGFLFHSPSQQILLHQLDLAKNPSSLWDMVGGMSREGENAQEAFLRILYERTNLKPMAKHIFPVYDYFYHAINKNHYVFYAEVKKLQTFPISPKNTFSWFTFRQTTKLAFTDQTKQDVIVSERVIRAQPAH